MCIKIQVYLKLLLGLFGFNLLLHVTETRNHSS
uniref:Uncharacterized protein n=1 Tax=Musa acuminata subsp. malaccensis TaxID=214687 RepID=A0A804I4Y8_MUSAM